MTKPDVNIDLNAQVVPATDPAPMFEAVWLGFYPFVPKDVSIETSRDIDFNKYYLRVEVRFGPTFTYSFTVDYDRDFALCWPHVARLELAEEIFKLCKYRGINVIPHNIVLGEE